MAAQERRGRPQLCAGADRWRIGRGLLHHICRASCHAIARDSKSIARRNTAVLLGGIHHLACGQEQIRGAGAFCRAARVLYLHHHARRAVHALFKPGADAGRGLFSSCAIGGPQSPSPVSWPLTQATPSGVFFRAANGNGRNQTKVCGVGIVFSLVIGSYLLRRFSCPNMDNLLADGVPLS